MRGAWVVEVVRGGYGSWARGFALGGAGYPRRGAGMTEFFCAGMAERWRGCGGCGARGCGGGVDAL